MLFDDGFQADIHFAAVVGLGGGDRPQRKSFEGARRILARKSARGSFADGLGDQTPGKKKNDTQKCGSVSRTLYSSLD